MPNRINIYNKTVDVLYTAYFNGTLIHGNFCGCAGGNLIAAALGYKVVSTRDEDGHAIWKDSEGISVYEGRAWYNVIQYRHSSALGVYQIEATGYEVEEMDRIEDAFEGAEGSSCDREERMLNGLVAVLEVLKDIHDIREEEHATNKYKFAHLYTEKQLAHV